MTHLTMSKTEKPAVVPPRPRLSRRLVRLAVRGGIVAVLIAAAVVAYHAVRSAEYGRRLNAVTAGLDAAGPWRVADLEAARAPVADADNAAPVVTRLAKQFGPTPGVFRSFTALDGRGTAYPLEHRYDAELWDVLTDRVQACGDLWADWPALLARPTGRFAHARSADGLDILTPHWADVRYTATAGDWLARFFAEADRPAEATQAVRGILHAANATGDEPWAITQHLRATDCAMAAASLERVLAQCEPTDADLAPLATLFAAEAARPTWKLLLVGERAAIDHELTALHAGGPALARLSARSAWRRSGVIAWVRGAVQDRVGVELRPAHAELLEAYTAAIAAADGPPAAQAEAAAALHARRQACLIDTPLEHWLLFSHFNDWSAGRRVAARIACARAALAAERHRLRAGAYPPTLADGPASPLTGAPLQYERTPTGAVVSDPADPAIRFRLFLPAHRRQPPLPVPPSPPADAQPPVLQVELTAP